MVPREEGGASAAATADAPQTASQQFTPKPNNPSTVPLWLGLYPFSRFGVIEAVCRETASPAFSRPRKPSRQTRIAIQRDPFSQPATPD